MVDDMIMSFESEPVPVERMYDTDGYKTRIQKCSHEHLEVVPSLTGPYIRCKKCPRQWRNYVPRVKKS